MRASLRLYTSLVIILHSLLPCNGQSGFNDISLITASPGPDAYSYFGHTAIKVEGSKSSEDIIYNFGTFDFDQPNFYTNFLKGKLLYSLSKQSYARLLQSYHYEQRSVYEQPLNLTEEQKNSLLRALRDNYKPENREYLYEFFFDNCSTRTRDLFESVYPDIQYDGPYRTLTFRELLEQHTCHYPLVDFGIDLIIGSRADRIATRSEQMFLPIYVHDHYNSASSGGKPVVKDDYLVLDFKEVDKTRSTPAFDYVTMFFFILLLLEIIFIVNRSKFSNNRILKLYDNIWYWILGIGSIVISVMWFATDHYATKANYNVIWMSPFYLLLFSKYKHYVSYLLIGLYIITAIVSLLGIQQYHWAVLPICCLTALKLIRIIQSTTQLQST